MVSHLIHNQWLPGEGQQLQSHDPATGHVVWAGYAATQAEIDDAVRAARHAAVSWRRLSLEERITFVEAFGSQLETHQHDLAHAISRETGKPRWEALSEVSAMIGKIPVSIRAAYDRLAGVSLELDETRGCTRYKPHGTLAVFGPFNLPGHLPNGHIVPALLAGNTLIFKPSERTPHVAIKTLELWQNAELPAGVLNLVQGGRATGEALASHSGLDGLLFTGSFAAGRALNGLLADEPGKILALEMGGNNPLVVFDAHDNRAAAYLTVLSAYLTAGQRCTCARRLIIPASAEGDRLLDQLIDLIHTIHVGPATDEPQPFMGPVISRETADHLLLVQQDLLDRGAQPLVKMERLMPASAFLKPGLIDVTAVPDRADEEVFGPLLQVIRVPDFKAAIAETNRTAYGLAASLFSDDGKLWETFLHEVRAGVVNWNRQTTGASGQLPFGGIGRSGNHRPGGYFAIDYCAYPVACIERDLLTMPARICPGLHP